MDFLACSLRNFKCLDYNGPLELKTDNKMVFYILSNEKAMLNIPMSYNYTNRFGLDEVDRLLRSFICYAQIEPSITDTNKRILVVNNFYVSCQMFTNALWFVKDNSVTPYFTTLSSDSQIEPESLRRNVYYSDSVANYEEILFTTAELLNAMRWYIELENLSVKKKVGEVELDMKPNLVNMSNFISFDIPSFQRAYYFLDSARRTDFLPSKIAAYITILECLFAVKGDNTHKVSERAAFLIGKSDEERIKVYDNVINAYKVRSLYVHGSEIKNNQYQLLPTTSSNLDSIVRNVLIKMLNEYPELNYKNGKSKKPPFLNQFEEVDNWFNNLVLKRGV